VLILVALALTAVILPGAVQARREGEKVTLAPVVSLIKNSQTMSLLQGYLNINPTGTGGPEIAIVDNTALSIEGENTGAFMDAGKNGKGEISVYIVRRGDTLPQVAKMFGVSTNTILWANNLKSSSLKEGQELVILPITGVRHIVKSGETLSSIAKKYNADLPDVLSYNELTSSSKIAVGDLVIIPDGVVRVTSSVGSIASGSGSSGGSVAVSSGYFMRPVNGRKTQGLHGHNGIDIGASPGTPIYAAAEGKVLIAKNGGYNGGYGSYVVISHTNGTQTLYGHMSSVNVSVGQSVSKGQSIGGVGNTGRSTGPHLHFEVRGARNPF
jgi:LysM repeat protein